jgi:hypothetical protein
LHVHEDAPCVLLLPIGHTEHDEAWAGLNVPAAHAEQAGEPVMAKVPAVQAVQTSDAPVPACAKPPLHVHVDAPKKPEVEPAGHATHATPFTL